LIKLIFIQFIMMAPQVALNAAFMRLGLGSDAAAILSDPARENLTI
jgi:hypothetical protein